MPPLDTPFRNITTGGIPGNHQTHASSERNTCTRCHSRSASYGFDHMTTVVTLSDNINGSPVPARYMPGVGGISFFGYTSVPPMASCSNVNCHFEAATPVWGSPPLRSPDDCSLCHGVPPTGTGPGYEKGAAGSHPKHEQYYSGPGNCLKCHPDHLGDPSVFAHATSIGHRNVAVTPRNLANTVFGTYSAPGNEGNLPSMAGSHAFGTCRNTYCHSAGTSLATGSIPTGTSNIWGSGPTPCNGCHGYPPTYQGGVPKANSHDRHAFGCETCHAATTTDGTTTSDRSRHVNGAYDVAPGPGITVSYTFAPTGGTCSNTSCHRNGTAVWGATTCGDCHTQSPAGD